MKPEIDDAVRQANRAALEQAQAPAPSKVELIGDTAVQLDSLGKLVEGVWFIGGHAASGLGAATQAVSDLLDSIPTLD